MVSNEVYSYALILRLVCIAMLLFVVHRQAMQVRVRRTKLRVTLLTIWCAMLFGNVMPFLFDLDHLVNNSDGLLAAYIMTNPTVMLIAATGVFVMYAFTDRFKE